VAILEALTNYVRLSAGLRNLPEADEKIMPEREEHLRKTKRTERLRKDEKVSGLNRK
jgi:hypothetical protein